MSSLARGSSTLSAPRATFGAPPVGLVFVSVSVLLHGLGAAVVAWLPTLGIEVVPPLPAELSFEVLADSPAPPPVIEPEPETAPVVAERPRDRAPARVAPSSVETVVASAPAEAGVVSTEGGLPVAAQEGGGAEGPLVLAPHGGAGGAGAGLAPPSGASGPDPRVLARAWMMRVNRAILERAVRDYPRAARRAELEGTVLVAIAVAEDGRITSVRIENGAGHETLDRAAIAAVQAVGQLPRPPELFTRRGRPLTMPITYRLR